MVQEDKGLNKVRSQEDSIMARSQERVQLSGSEGIDGYGTQDSDLNNFARHVGVVVADSQELESLVEDPCQPIGGTNFSNSRRSSRLKESEEVNVIDKATERAKVKDLEKGKGIVSTFPSIINSSNESLFQIASSLGISLGCSLDMAKGNLDLLRLQEQARVNLLLKSRKNKGQMTAETSTNQEDSEFVVFQESLSYEDVEDNEVVESNLNLVQLASVGRKKKKGGYPDLYSVKPSLKGGRGIYKTKIKK